MNDSHNLSFAEIDVGAGASVNVSDARATASSESFQPGVRHAR